MRHIDTIIIHCTATPEGRDYTVGDIDRWHRQRGWQGIGYHFVIYRDGSVHRGRPIGQAGAHCAGHNAHSIGVCYIGGCAADGKTPKDTRTNAQKAALLKLLRQLKDEYPQAQIHGHRFYNPHKACPSFDAGSEYASL